MYRASHQHAVRSQHILRVTVVVVTLVAALGLATLAASAAPAPQAGTYTVQRGDTLYRVAVNNGTTVSNLVNLNGGTYPSLYTNPGLIFPGWVLTVSGSGSTTTTPPASGGTYTVKAGDYLARIAANNGTTVATLISLNTGTYPSLQTNPNLIYVGWVLSLPSGSSSGTSPAPSPAPTGGFELGGQATGLSHASEMHTAGMLWVKVQHKWQAGEDPAAEAGFINNAHDQGFKVLYSVTGLDHPTSIDYNAYANYVAGLASKGADGIEVWNEMNFDREWPAGQISGSNYVNNMLRPAYNAIKGANNGTMVISGAPTPTGAFPFCGASIGSQIGCNDDTYIAQMAAAGATSYTDCIGMHYNAGTTSPYATSGSPNPYHYSWYYSPMVNLYHNAFGGARKLCITELGYLSGEGYGSLPTSFSWASGTSVAEQAQWLAENTVIARDSRRVRLMVVYNVDFTDFGADPQAGYAIIRPGGGCPACDSLHGVTGGS